ncbi:copper resistance CopC/CopD family protein [Nocardioides euryhalodurans]|uniref:Copper resistance protein CopC n=1 Tax=Nocardioides euryhalodurans TaxID=2518370 RepID=A0A4V1BE71_9ACTN|nr:copper resistance protein CopC [Nocardioides euryhalodurans]QBR93602.1 copper resistance protein CopC [Nocardioides euryhalodurans]
MTVGGRPVRWRLGLRLAVTALVAACAVLLGAGPAAAHAELLGTDPADGAVLDTAPEAVTLTFTEPVRLTDREITVYDAAGVSVPSEAAASDDEVTVTLTDPEALGRGTFVVAWAVISADGHPISGSITFSVGEPSAEVADPPPAPTSSGAVTAVQGVLAGLTYLGLLVAAGLAAFVALVLPGSYGGQQTRLRIRRTTRVAAAVATVAALLMVPVASTYAQGLELGDLPGSLDPGLVTAEILSVVLLVAGLGVVVVSLSSVPPDRTQRPALLVGAALAVASPAVVGHTRSYQPEVLLVVSDVVHVAAGATWLGGLVGLVVALRALAGREELAAVTLARFSALAGGLLLAVAATGTMLAWRILGSWSAFLDTTYGQLLLVKIGLALVVAALGGWNRFGMLPRVRAAAGFGDRTRAATLVSRTLVAEATVVVALLGVTGFLVNQSPRPAPVDAPEGTTGVEAAESSGDLQVYAALSPRRQGATTLLVQLQDGTGEPVTPPTAPEVSLRSGDVDLGDVELTASDAGTWQARVVLPRAGVWEVQVSTRLSRFEAPVSTVRIDVPE